MLPMNSQLTMFMLTGSQLMKVVLSELNSYRKRRRSTAMR
jgi:hypothetical protein